MHMKTTVKSETAARVGVGRPAESSAEDTKERIVHAAVQAFSTRGFAAVSTRALAAEAGVNIATLNYHFGSKQGVYHAAVDEVYRRLGVRGARMLPRIAGLSMHGMMEEIYRSAREEATSIRLLLREVLDHDGLTEHTRRDHFLPSIGTYAAQVGALVDVPERTARELLVTMGLMIGRIAVQDPETLREAYGCADLDETHTTVIRILCGMAQTLMRTT